MKLYYHFLNFAVLPFMTLGGIVTTFGALPLIGSGTLYELFSYVTLAICLFGNNRRFLRSKDLPFRNLFILFAIYLLIHSFRNFVAADVFSEKAYYLRALPFIFVFNAIISAPQPELALKRVIKILILSAITITLSTVFVGATGTEIPGLNHEQYERLGRVIWGYPGTILLASAIILAQLGYQDIFKRHSSFKTLTLLSTFTLAIFFTQSRFLLIALILSIIIILFQDTKVKFTRSLILSFLIIGIGVLFSSKDISRQALSRFSELSLESNIPTELLLSGESFESLGRLAPLVFALKSNEGLDIWIGAGYHTGFLTTSQHLHSGLGYIYVTSGILGLIIVYGLLIKIILHYQRFAKRSKITSFEIPTMRAVIILLKIRMLSSLVIGNMLQESFVVWGVMIGLLELCRRSIIEKQHIYHLLNE